MPEGKGNGFGSQLPRYNPNDPRYQREIQRVASAGSMSPKRGVLRSRIGEVAARHAGHQLGRQIEFGKLAQANQRALLRDKIASHELAQRERALGLAESGLAFDRYKLGKTLGDQKRALNTSMLMGGGTAILGALEGYRQRKAIEQLVAAQEARSARIDEFYRNARFNTLPYPVYQPGSSGPILSGLGGR